MSDTYASMGVDVSEADRGIQSITKRIKQTWPRGYDRRVMMDIGYFANVVDIGDGRGLASTTDGVGSKTIIADLAGKYDTIGIDCVAMNVNDLICIGATPISMVDYIGVEKADSWMLDEIAQGLVAGAMLADISITGGEISQLPDNIRGFDLVGTAFGMIDIDRIIDGRGVQPGDAILGIASSGIHSNGFTMVRKTLPQDNLHAPRDEFQGRSILQELITPTEIYVHEVLALVDSHDVQALVNITGDGLLNLNRINCPGVGFFLDRLPEPHPIFKMIQEKGGVDDATMYQTFNMGVGFCAIVPGDQEDSALEVLQSEGKKASVIGHVIEDMERNVYITQRSLVGREKRFEKA